MVFAEVVRVAADLRRADRGRPRLTRADVCKEIDAVAFADYTEDNAIAAVRALVKRQPQLALTILSFAPAVGWCERHQALKDYYGKVGALPALIQIAKMPT
jgi:hypothetical protein